MKSTDERRTIYKTQIDRLDEEIEAMIATHDKVKEVHVKALDDKVSRLEKFRDLIKYVEVDEEPQARGARLVKELILLVKTSGGNMAATCAMDEFVKALAATLPLRPQADQQ